MVDQEGEYLLVIKSTGDIPYSDSTKLLNISGARLWPLNIGREIIFWIVQLELELQLGLEQEMELELNLELGLELEVL